MLEGGVKSRELWSPRCWAAEEPSRAIAIAIEADVHGCLHASMAGIRGLHYSIRSALGGGQTHLESTGCPAMRRIQRTATACDIDAAPGCITVLSGFDAPTRHPLMQLESSAAQRRR